MTPRPPESPATAFAVALLEEFHRLGVRDIVLGPGSRSQALALAAAEFERLGMIRLRVRIDEREVMILEPALSAGREALWRQAPDLQPLGVRPLLLGPTEARRTYLRAFAWALEALPDDIGETRAIRAARDDFSGRGILPDLPDFSHTPELTCENAFSPC